MNWRLLARHPWCGPLDLLARCRGEANLALLYSGRQEKFSGGASYLLLDPAFHATGSRWEDLPAPHAEDDGLPDWVGYLGYGMRCHDGLARGDAPPLDWPDFWLTRYQRLFAFDHASQTLCEYGRYHATQPWPWPPKEADAALPAVATLHSSLNRAEYEMAVHDTIAAIEAGDFYQANITRKFYGRLAAAPDGLTLFRRLCTLSPAPYSAFIRHGGRMVLSSSPECFLQIAGDGTMMSRPIKGSIRRGANVAEDAALRKALAESGKNLAENLMIVDLMRHDLAQVSEVGSVTVREQSALYSYATIHHLVSTVKARLRANVSSYDAVRACFPPGSMTGAPKRAAMQWCNARERLERGVYSGAIGWFGGGGVRCDLSVVIRTLLIDGADYEFQVGGGIVADSTPEDEWHETLTKARAVAQALGIEEEALKQL